MRLALVVTDPRRQTKRVAVTSARFTIGSAPDNDLVIEGAGVSRRHLLIESFDGVAQAVECGSVVLLKGQPIVGVARLNDWDLLSLGDGCEIEIRLETDVPPDQGRSEPFNETYRAAKRKQIIAALIALAALTAFAVAVRRELAGGPQERSATLLSPVSDGVESVSGDPDTNKKDGVSTESASLMQVRRLTRQVISRISRDARSYDFPENVVREVERRVEQYRSSPAVGEALRAISSGSATPCSSHLRMGVRGDFQGMEVLTE